ncbi:succinate dehydrogenase, hydrophobic membrane anchor protein [Ostreibacterium oceani]|uniref:Succinate dehydrogenase hydrophobic membrane anchor subunit n=1 Tax=Ostreibacterium oceani TaxID=2654998 RepID=A0A6N7ETQ8_9GAMM|nr:succinate dehydrogenase, hydrophobic membrane anchor protein [Ostreibacterium oceani]MPV85941.1 succinate dehydrogenase, hydrophobic membrane anchor protein [Ostreibacterium oceani]
MKFRTPLKKAKGQGAAGSGTAHFIHQRFTAVALIPLTFLFVCFLMSLLAAERFSEVADKLSNPFWTTTLLLFLCAAFYHGMLGVQIIIEDYISSKKAKLALLIALRLAVAFFALLGILSVLFIALS